MLRAAEDLSKIFSGDIDRDVLLSLRKQLRTQADRTDEPELIARDSMVKALSTVGMKSSDKEVMDRLFSMLDKTGAQAVNHTELMVGIAPIIDAGDEAKIAFAFEMLDFEGTGVASKEDFSFILKTTSDVCEFLRHTSLTQQQIEETVEDVFRDVEVDENGSAQYNSEFIGVVCDHPILQPYITRSMED